MSQHHDAVEAYFQGFRLGDHDAILGLLTEEVIWDLPGRRHLQGKVAFDGEIEDPAFEGNPVIAIDRLIEDGDAVVAVGTGSVTHRRDGAFEFAFCDVFTFEDDLIARVESYVVPLSPT